jgi:hypothetical protein
MSMPPPQPPGQPQYPQYQQQPQQPYGQYPVPQPPPGSSKTPVWVWVLVAAGVVIVLCLAAVGVGGYFLVKKVQQAGFDPTLMQKNPALALAKMAASLNPDYETISTDDATGTITVREKSTGKSVTLKFDADKKTLVVVDEDGKQSKIAVAGDDKSGSVTVQSPEGTVKFGASAGNNAPAWAPVYPGASTEGTLSTQTPDGNQNTFTFKTKDPADKVLAYYQDQLKSAGFSVNTIGAGSSGGMVQAEDKSKNRSLIITAGTSGDGTEGSVTAVEKK